MFTITERACDD